MEVVGVCAACQKTVYCRDGFLDGVVDDDKKLYCHSCYEDVEKNNRSSAEDIGANKVAK